MFIFASLLAASIDACLRGFLLGKIEIKYRFVDYFKIFVIIFFGFLLKNQGIYAMLYTEDREILYQALLFETIRWNFMNGGDRYGIIPVLRTRRVREHACSSYA